MGCCQSVQDKGQQGGLAPGEATSKTRVLSQLGLGGLVELRIACKGLPKKDKLSESDPIAVVYVSGERGQTQWVEAGRTEVVANTSAPEFVRPVLVRQTGEAQQPLRVVVYDADVHAKRAEDLKLASQDYLGEAELLVTQVLGAPGKVVEVPLVDLEGGKQLAGCVLVLKGEEMAGTDELVRLAFCASGLAAGKGKGAATMSPFLRILKQRPAGDWVPVLKTEVVEKTGDPVWRPIELESGSSAMQSSSGRSCWRCGPTPARAPTSCWGSTRPPWRSWWPPLPHQPPAAWSWLPRWRPRGDSSRRRARVLRQ